MSSAITGEWKQFEFKFIGHQDLQQVLASLRNNFYVDEPLNNMVGSTGSEERMQDMDKVITIAVSEGLSLMAVEKESGKVAGVQIMYANYEGKPSISSFLPCNPITELVRECCKPFHAEPNIFDRFGVTEYAYIGYTSVDRQFRNLGIALELWKRSKSVCKERNIFVIESLCTGPHSRNAALKCGFKETKRKYFTAIQDENPSPHYTRKANPDEYMAEMVLKLL